jgi:ribosomal protein S18 acetylase RimI-like enzyme
MSLKIRIATIEDAPEIAAIVNSVYRGDVNAQGWTTEAHLIEGERISTDQVREFIQARGEIILCAERDGAIQGLVHLKNHHPKAYLGMLSVRANQQGGGVGARLIAESEAYVQREWKCSNVYMWVLTIRHELINWYVRKGYTVGSERVPYANLGAEAGHPKVAHLEFAVLTRCLATSDAPHSK